MDTHLDIYVSYDDSANIYFSNLTSTAFVLYSPSHILVHINGMCVGAGTNNKVEYDALIGILTDYLHMTIHHLYVHLDSQLLIS